MNLKTGVVNSVDEYIASFPKEIQIRLQQLRETIMKTAPGAEEVISYQIPAYKLNGMLVYFAAYEKHIGFYPTSSGIAHFRKELSIFKGAKGSVQFPLDKPLPLQLVAKITAFRAKENLQKAQLGVKKKKS